MKLHVFGTLYFVFIVLCNCEGFCVKSGKSSGRFYQASYANEQVVKSNYDLNECGYLMPKDSGEKYYYEDRYIKENFIFHNSFPVGSYGYVT